MCQKPAYTADWRPRCIVIDKFVCFLLRDAMLARYMPCRVSVITVIKVDMQAKLLHITCWAAPIQHLRNSVLRTVL